MEIAMDFAGTQQLTKDGSRVRKCRVADRTGSIVFSVWNDEAEAINAGDIIKLTRGYASVWKGTLVLYCGKYGLVERLGEFTMLFSETPNMSLCIETSSSSSSSATGGRQNTVEVNGSGNSGGSDNSVPDLSTSKASHPLLYMEKESPPAHKCHNGHVKIRLHQSHDIPMTQQPHRHHPYSRQTSRESWR
jgi:hypothetical protein